jgi:hypothetical protein
MTTTEAAGDETATAPLEARIARLEDTIELCVQALREIVTHLEIGPDDLDSAPFLITPPSEHKISALVRRAQQRLHAG